MINAVELPDNSIGRTIQFETVAAWEYHAMKFGVELGAKITVTGRVAMVKKVTQLGGRTAVKVTIDVVDSDGHEYRTQFTLGSHNRFVWMDENSGDDPVPVGSNKPSDNWTRRDESTVRWSERLERDGSRPAGYTKLVMHEMSRLIRRRAGDAVPVSLAK